MSDDFYGAAYVGINGDEIEVEHIDIDTELSDREVFGMERRECDDCGGVVHPINMILVASTKGDVGGVYHKDCRPE